MSIVRFTVLELEAQSGFITRREAKHEAIMMKMGLLILIALTSVEAGSLRQRRQYYGSPSSGYYPGLGCPSCGHNHGSYPSYGGGPSWGSPPWSGWHDGSGWNSHWSSSGGNNYPCYPNCGGSYPSGSSGPWGSGGSFPWGPPSYPGKPTDKPSKPSRPKPTREPPPPAKPTEKPACDSDEASGSGQSGSVGCGVQAPQLQPMVARRNPFLLANRIINGREAKANSWPWAVAFTQTVFGVERVVCGGSLIRVKDGVESSDIVLTAAHCVTTEETMETDNPRPIPSNLLTIVAGRHKYNTSGKYSQRKLNQGIRLHPRFSSSPTDGTYNDVALVKLSSPIKFSDGVRPVCMPTQNEQIPSDKVCVVVGWGRNSTTNPIETSEALQQLVTPVHTAAVCSKNWAEVYRQESMICSGSLKGDSGVCMGDSGNLLACRDPTTNRWVQQGIVSFGVGGNCLAENQPAVFTRVAGFSDWIKKTIKELSSL